ncbi:DUF4231 domain-containing protein [Microcoleus sp. D2_18a_D3]|uniref:DUF4231 domain-containing protein n=1 Tax=Microcoleus sp. D2_18a_D3 TaxID=3055330 RepID=UPI002FD0DD85
MQTEVHMAKKTSYYDYLRQEMTDMVEQLELPDLCKQSLKSRWLDQVVWADKKAEECRRWHYRLRLTAIVGGVLLPAVVGINFQLGKDNEYFRFWFPYVPFVLSQIIAVSAAAEEFMRFGDRWREYRQLAEELKAEGWEYLQLSGPYRYKTLAEDDTPPPLSRSRMSEVSVEDWKALKPRSENKESTTHQDVYTLFAGRVESLIKNDVQNYITALQQKQAKEQEQIKQILKTVENVSTDKTLFARPTPAPQQPPYGAANQPNNGYGAMGIPAQHPAFNAPGQPSIAPVPPQNTPMPQTAWAQPPAAFAPPPPPSAPMPQPTVAQPPTGFAPPPAPTQMAFAQPPAAFAAAPSASAPVQQTASADLNARILASTLKLRGMSTAEGPDGGNNACAWTVNKVIQDASLTPLGANPNYVPAVLEALKQGRGQLVPRESAKAGDLVVADGEAHIGIGLTDGCSRVLSNSSSRACFVWESDTDFDGSYGGKSTIYRLKT